MGQRACKGVKEFAPGKEAEGLEAGSSLVLVAHELIPGSDCSTGVSEAGLVRSRTQGRL